MLYANSKICFRELMNSTILLVEFNLLMVDYFIICFFILFLKYAEEAVVSIILKI